MTCDQCGAELHVGDWPYCPHGQGLANVIPDDIPGGQWFENGFETPRKFYSHSEHRAALAAEGCEIRAKWAGPLDRYLKRWDIPDAYTLAAAKALVTRGRSRPQSDPEPEEAPVITSQDTGTTFTVRAT